MKDTYIRIINSTTFARNETVKSAIVNQKRRHGRRGSDVLKIQNRIIVQRTAAGAVAIRYPREPTALHHNRRKHALERDDAPGEICDGDIGEGSVGKA
jgi:hypothetical protein